MPKMDGLEATREIRKFLKGRGGDVNENEKAGKGGTGKGPIIVAVTANAMEKVCFVVRVGPDFRFARGCYNALLTFDCSSTHQTGPQKLLRRRNGHVPNKANQA